MLILLYFSVGQVASQDLELGFTVGASTYQGDINFSRSRLSMQGAKLQRGMHLAWHMSDYYALKMRWTTGSISADDRYSLDNWRRYRNLHFRSSIQEVAMIHEIELFDIVKFFRKYNIKPYFSIGLAWFRFNPQAQYKGEWIDLHPLSTEGQGIISGVQPYSLNQISIPLTIGIKYFLRDDLYFGIEVGPRMTFTDYLDDVSAVYPDFENLRQYRGQQAVDMSYRGNLVSGSDIDLTEVEGMGRGNSQDNDWYIFSSFVIGYRFNPKESMKRRKAFRHGRKCNFFGKM